jgi:hypothetical protein
MWITTPFTRTGNGVRLMVALNMVDAMRRNARFLNQNQPACDGERYQHKW